MNRRAFTAFLQPLELLPSQLPRREGPRRCPEMRLVAAVLEDAIRSVHTGRSRRRPSRFEFQAARAWLLDDSRDWPFAFANVCDLLGLDATAVRRSLSLEGNQQ